MKSLVACRFAGACRLVALGSLITAGIVATAPTVTAQAQELQMYVSVLDDDDRPIADLTVDDFVLREDGVLREVLRVQPATEPMHVALLIDNSAASAQYLRDMRDGLGEFARRVGGDHEVAVITFGDRPTIVEDYTRSAIELQQAIGKVFPRPGSGALLLDAIYNAGEGLQRREVARPVMVAVTTMGTEYSNRGYQPVLRIIHEVGAIFHAVVMTSTSSSMDTASRYRDIVLDRGTSEAGGRRIDLLRGQMFRQAMERVADELLSQYLLVYARPEMLVPPDEIVVSTTRPDWTARGRSAGVAP
ncbi:MAG: VWA domain-containing protein [Vicinamibacterales bacterium]|nr:VWA domain-containing protein [Vicinamibacterales bacterium]